MKAEQTISLMFKKYPELFIYREDCLDHLFLTIGNGYRWIKGQLVEEYDGLKTRDVEDYDDSKINDLKEYQTSENIEKYLKQRKFIVEKTIETSFKGPPDSSDIISRYREGKTLHCGWYPYSKDYSLINSIPRNVKKDWKNLALELLECLRRENITLDLSDKTRKILGIKD